MLKCEPTHGWLFAFGNTVEHLRSTVLGLSARGDPSDGPLDRRTGTGWVAETTDHDYADAQAKGHGVSLLATESTGAIDLAFILLLRSLGKQSTAPGSQDHTVYGTARSSPHTFFAHHTSAISAAVVTADAEIVLNTAASMCLRLSLGVYA